MRLVVKSHKGGNCRLRSLESVTGKGLKRAKGENPNPLYAVPIIAQPFINSPEAKLNKVEIARTYFIRSAHTGRTRYIIDAKLNTELI